MLKVSAVICELNPFHEGHRYIFERAHEESDVLIAVMSGNFVQRGECAIYNKYARADSAIDGGADIVVELPFPYSSASAEFFAAAGVKLCEAAGADSLYFGSECADGTMLRKAAEVLDSSDPKGAGRAAERREECLRLSGINFPESIYSAPNDILAAEYYRNASIECRPIKRILTEGASEKRRLILDKVRRGESACAPSGARTVDPEKLTAFEFCNFRRHSVSTDFAEGGGGVARRLQKAALSVNDSEKWMPLAATKQYTNARLRRCALFEVTATTAEMLRAEPKYIKILAFNRTGRKYLSFMKGVSRLPVITNPAEGHRLMEDALAAYAFAEDADRLFSLIEGSDDPAVYAKARPVIIE